MVRYLFNCLNELESFREDCDIAIITDIDGTISEIGSMPMKAEITPAMRNILDVLSTKFKFVGVLTGRDIKDALNIIKLKHMIYIGNHVYNSLKMEK